MGIRAVLRRACAARSRRFKTDSLGKCIKCTSGRTARSGRRAWIVRREKVRYLTLWIGTSGIGPAPMRPFKSRRDPDDQEGVYRPFIWRGWQDFGTGALRDMACHTVNRPFRALNLGYPTEIEAMPFGQMNKESYPVGSKIRFQFPERKTSISVAQPHLFHHHRKIEQDALTLWWYDGGQPDPAARGGHDLSNKPSIEVTADIIALRGDVSDSGCLLIGDNGSVFSPDDYGTSFFVKLKDDQRYIHYTKHPALAQFAERIPSPLWSQGWHSPMRSSPGSRDRVLPRNLPLPCWLRSRRILPQRCSHGVQRVRPGRSPDPRVRHAGVWRLLDS
jgi:hypothetical protein